MCIVPCYITNKTLCIPLGHHLPRQYYTEERAWFAFSCLTFLPNPAPLAPNPSGLLFLGELCHLPSEPYFEEDTVSSSSSSSSCFFFFLFLASPTIPNTI